MTRQIANILEDLDRQIISPASISLLYGENGVGKSRLLQQFVSTRLSNYPATLLHFSADGTYSLGDRNYSQLEFSDNVLQRLETHSVLILDQFEHALSDIQRRILTYWSQMAKNKDLKLVLCGTRQAVADLSSLSGRFGSNISSVELKPLSETDSREYLAVQICASPSSYPVIPRHVKKQIKRSDGLFSNLDKLCQQHSGSIECVQKATTRANTMSLTLVSGLFAVALLVIAVAVYLFNGDQGVEQLHAQQSLQPSDSRRTMSADKAIDDPVTMMDGRGAPGKKEPQSMNQVDSPPEIKPLNSDSQILVDPSMQRPRDPVNQESQPLSVLQQRLQATEDWLAEADEQSASIQVMTLAVRSNADVSLGKYLDKLNAKGVDLEKIFIYSAPKNNTHIYGVLYGTYTDRQRANQQLNELPDILKTDKPIPRSLTSIKREINKNKLL